MGSQFQNEAYSSNSSGIESSCTSRRIIGVPLLANGLQQSQQSLGFQQPLDLCNFLDFNSFLDFNNLLVLCSLLIFNNLLVFILEVSLVQVLWEIWIHLLRISANKCLHEISMEVNEDFIMEVSKGEMAHSSQITKVGTQIAIDLIVVSLEI